MYIIGRYREEDRDRNRQLLLILAPTDFLSQVQPERSVHTIFFTLYKHSLINRHIYLFLYDPLYFQQTIRFNAIQFNVMLNVRRKVYGILNKLVIFKLVPYWPNRQCYLAGSSKKAPRIWIFSMAMGADYIFI